MSNKKITEKEALLFAEKETERLINSSFEQIEKETPIKLRAFLLKEIKEAILSKDKKTDPSSIEKKIYSHPDFTPEDQFKLLKYFLRLEYHIIEEENKRLKEELKKKESKGKFKRSGHLTDQILKYEYPKDKNRQLSIFDSLEDATKKDIKIAGIEISEVVEGIRLTSSETKVIDCLCKLLHQNSQTVEPNSKDYYTGNLNPDIVDYSNTKGKAITSAPKLSFTLYELTKDYKGGEAISGKDVENVKNILSELNGKKFLIKYTEKTKGTKGEWIKKEYEAFRKLINIDKATLSYGVGDIEEYKKTESIIVLNPIFRRHIDSKFILYPNDIIKRTAIAYGSHNISDITIRLRDYLMRLHSSPKMLREITLHRLYYLVAEKWMNESRKKKVRDYTNKALDVMIDLGLLESYEIKASKTGEPKIVFKLNKEWE